MFKNCIKNWKKKIDNDIATLNATFQFLVIYKCYLRKCVHVLVYNVNLYNLIISKYRWFITCVYCYYVMITFYYKISDLKNKDR